MQLTGVRFLLGIVDQHSDSDDDDANRFSDSEPDHSQEEEEEEEEEEDHRARPSRCKQCANTDLDKPCRACHKRDRQEDFDWSPTRKPTKRTPSQPASLPRGRPRKHQKPAPRRRQQRDPSAPPKRRGRPPGSRNKQRNLAPQRRPRSRSPAAAALVAPVAPRAPIVISDDDDDDKHDHDHDEKHDCDEPPAPAFCESKRVATPPPQSPPSPTSPPPQRKPQRKRDRKPKRQIERKQSLSIVPPSSLSPPSPPAVPIDVAGGGGGGGGGGGDDIDAGASDYLLDATPDLPIGDGSDREHKHPHPALPRFLPPLPLPLSHFPSLNLPFLPRVPVDHAALVRIGELQTVVLDLTRNLNVAQSQLQHHQAADPIVQTELKQLKQLSTDSAAQVAGLRTALARSQALLQSESAKLRLLRAHVANTKARLEVAPLLRSSKLRPL